MCYLCAMFTAEEFDILRREDVRRAIDANIDRDPVQIALDRHVPEAAAVATQVKRLQRAAAKLPSYHAVRAILPPLAYEQSSSEECAARKLLSGGSVLDLTCGLGVDALALSRRFERVVTVERDSVLAAVARENFARLGATNIEVVNASAEDFVRDCRERFDWCYADPDRRGADGEKLVRLEECSPDIVSLRGRIAEIADRLCVKCSPLFDVAEAFRIFGDCRVETVSMRGECKEVNIYADGSQPTISAVAVGQGGFATGYPASAEWCAEPKNADEYRWLTLPDAALQHSRLVAAAFAGKADVWSDNSVALSAEMPEGVLGRTFAIEEAVRFDEKTLRKRLRGKRIEIIRRDFPLTNGALCARLGIREGGDERWCFARIGGRGWAVRLGRQEKK